MIIYYFQRALTFAQLNHLSEADENFFASHQQCLALSDDLQQRIDTQMGIDTNDEILLINNEVLDPGLV